MIIKYGTDFDVEAIRANIKRLLNQIFKLLPSREEGSDWRLPLSSIIEELAGMDSLLMVQQDKFFSLLCRLEGLLSLTEEKDFAIYRKTIFECLNILEQINKGIGGEQCNP